MLKIKKRDILREKMSFSREKNLLRRITATFLWCGIFLFNRIYKPLPSEALGGREIEGCEKILQKIPKEGYKDKLEIKRRILGRRKAVFREKEVLLLSFKEFSKR